MRYLFYIMGKSASGKDTLYEALQEETALGLKKLVPYTTRPIRAGETDGVDYHFTDEAGLRALEESGRVIELREYATVHGPWKYFTVDETGMGSGTDGSKNALPGNGMKDAKSTAENGDPAAESGAASGDERANGDRVAQGSAEAAPGPAVAGEDYLAIGTPESYRKICGHYGADKVIPIYVEVDDGLRLARALARERKPGNGKYEEMCRRFLADQRDFSEEKLAEAGIARRFRNDGEFETLLREVREMIRGVQQGH